MLSRRTFIIIIVIVLAAGLTPVTIRFTQHEGVPSLVIVLIRLWLVSLGLFPIVWTRYRKELLGLSPRQIALAGVGGFWLALNLFMLFLALEYTSVFVTDVLRRTTPLWIILPEIVLFGAVFSRRFWFSLFLSIVGAILIGIGSLSAINAGVNPLLGAGMAGFGAICFGIYLLIGRKLNNTMPSLLYSFMVFFSAAIVTSFFVAITGTYVTGYSVSGYLWVLVVTVLAQVLGHIFINLGLQIFTATAMAIILQMGVAMSAFSAMLFFGEIPSVPQFIGSVFVIIGVIMATVEQTRRDRKRKSELNAQLAT